MSNSMVKHYFPATKEEQAKRFERSKPPPLGQWKLSEIDLQVQDPWDDCTNQQYEILKKTTSNFIHIFFRVMTR